MVHRKNLAAPRNLAPAAGMNSERWQQVKHALDSVLGLQSPQRSPYLEKLSSGDPELHREVESLLRSHEQAGNGFLRDPAVAILPDFEMPRYARTGRRIGAYDMLEEIGRGGMGEVYRAVRADGEFDREVAVKLVRVGLDTQFASRRLSRAQAASKWREARSWYQKSLALWIDKSKRGELESEERDEQQYVLTQIARCDAELHESASRRQH
jgi:hypothetical protein